MTDLSKKIADLSPEQQALLLRRLGKLQRERPSAGPERIPTQPRTTNQFPLSFAQQRLWFLQQLEPGSASYHIPQALRLTGALDAAALERCYHTIIRRHEALRTIFVETSAGSEPVQIILPFQPQPLALVDLSALAPAAREAEVARLASAEASRPFDLATGPLVRATLLRLAANDHIVLLTLHHIISDGWSLGVLVRELAALYSAAEPESALPPLAVQYADYAVWQRGWMEGETYHRQLDYWQQQLRAEDGRELPLLRLPTDRPRPPVQTFHGAIERHTLPAALTAALRTLSDQAGATLFMTLLAAFDVLLYRFTGQTDLLVGTPIAGRRQTETEPLIGCFVNTLVLRADLRGNPTFRALLGRVRETALGAYAHQDLPFELLVDALHVERNLSHAPLFQVMFILQNTPMPTLSLPRLTISPVQAETSAAKFDLTVNLTEVDDTLDGIFEYNTDLFDAATIRRMIEHFETLLAALVAEPDRPIAEIELLSQAERTTLLERWNATALPYDRQRCMHELVAAQVERTPEATALLYRAADDQIAGLSYAELERRANQLAHYLRAQIARASTAAEVRVAVCLQRTPELVVALLAVLKAGAAYVPLDPAYPGARLQFMIADSAATVLLTTSGLVALEPPAGTAVIELDRAAALIAAQPTHAPASPISSDQLAYVIYTSGSTGTPKGVAIEHRNAVALLAWAQQVYSSEELAGVLFATSVCFDISIFELFLPLSVGGTVILAGNVLELPQLAAATTITLIDTVPSAMAALLQAGDLPASVRTVNLAGETLPAALVQQVYAQPQVARVYNMYGPSEDTTYSTFALVPRAVTTPAIGRPIANTQLYVLDARMQPVPIGVAGELYIGGDGLTRGYLGRPALTAEKFVPNPFGEPRTKNQEPRTKNQEPGIRNQEPNSETSEQSLRLYKTGDLVRYRADGELEFLSRVDQQVKLRGFRVELDEIAAVLRQHPQVQAAVVVAQHRALPGQTTADTQLVAYVAVAEPRTGSLGAHQELGGETDGSQFLVLGSSNELRQFLAERLPEYMLPTTFVLLPALPLTPSGKIDRQALPPVDVAQQRTASYVAPRTAEEQAMATLWAEVLGIARVGVDDNFFSLGGHSLLATRLIGRLRVAEQIDLPLRCLFETPTVAGLTQQITTLRQRLAQAQPVVSELADDEIEGEL